MIQRRKAATYGKASRKPISDFSTFAEVSEPATEHAYQPKDGAKASTAERPAVELVQRSALLRAPLGADGTISAELPSPMGDNHGKAESNFDVHDFDSSDEDFQRSASVSDSGLRKRRKTTPMDDEPSTSIVFDDESLQRHIAAELRLESTIASIATGEAASNLQIPLAYGQDKSEASRRKKSLPVNVRDQSSKSRPRLNATRSPTDLELKASVSKQAVSPNHHDHKTQQLMSPSRKGQGTKKGSAQSTRDQRTPPKTKITSALSGASLCESQSPQAEQGPSPSTPPRPRSSAGVATTPKQRELWGKLLSHDTHTTSPGVLDLPGLRIDVHKAQSKSPTLRPRMPISGRAANVRNGKRSTKLVDFLSTADGDGSTLTVESTEENESSDVEAAESVQSELSINDDVLTLRTTPSAGSQGRSLQIHDPGLMHSSQPISLLQEAPKVTYIRERTHLGDDGLSDTAMLNMPLIPESGFSKKRQQGTSDLAQIKADLENDMLHDLDDVQDPHGGALRSIHELREAGGNTRIVGELEAIFDDLDDRLGSSISSKRSSLMSLTSKLLEASTCRMLVDQGLEPRLLALVNFSHELIERSLLAMTILQVLFHTTTATFISQTNQVRTSNLLIGLLGHGQDLVKLAKLRETNMSKLAQSEYSILCSRFLGSPVWGSVKPSMLSGQILALQALDLLVRQAREAGFFSNILSVDAISSVAQNTISSVRASQLLTTYSKVCLQLGLSILEGSTVNGVADIQDFKGTDQTIECICDIFPLIADGSGHEFDDLRILTLRLYLNLTNSNPPLCEIFSKPSLVSTIFKSMYNQFERLSEPNAQDQVSSLLTNLILSLGCLINLAESSNSMRELIFDLKTPGGSFLEALLQLFLKKRGKAAEAYSEEEAGNNVAFGYLSVLLSYLCINDAVSSYVNARLEGPNLAVLLDAVEEFLSYHRQIDDDTAREVGGKDRRASFADRLQGVVNKLRCSG